MFNIFSFISSKIVWQTIIVRPPALSLQTLQGSPNHCGRPLYLKQLYSYCYHKMAENPKLSKRRISLNKNEKLFCLDSFTFIPPNWLNEIKNPVVLGYVKVKSEPSKGYMSSSSEDYFFCLVLCLSRSISYASWIWINICCASSCFLGLWSGCHTLASSL